MVASPDYPNGVKVSDCKGGDKSFGAARAAGPGATAGPA
jgi:hypothetical protein